MGGVAGHMAHLSEDTDLTFNEIVNILGKVSNAEIENATEKVDGQNLFLSWTVGADGEVRTARNKGDISKGGMTTDEYIGKWKGHPAENAFTNGFKAISAALRKLTPEDLELIFADGQRYVNMEVMYPGNPNIILYSAPNVVLHGLQYFGEEEETPESKQLTKQKFSKLVELVDGGIEQVGNENWKINGPKIVALKKLADGSALEEVKSKIEAFAAPVGMDATLGDYIEKSVRRYAEQVDMSPDIADKLITLMLEPEEAKSQAISVTSLKKGQPKELQSVISRLGTKTNSRKFIASILKPIEIAISDFAIEVLRGVKSYFVDNNDKEVGRMRAELEKSINYLKALQSSGDEKMGELIDKQLAKLGKIENVASSMEGVVFEYPPGSDKIYKLTGAFAMANQIIGRARRSGMTENESSNLTIRISKDKEITKSLEEWLKEIKASKHSYTKLPQSVYEDILNGTAIVDIVEEDNAIPTVYNAVMGYVKGFLGEENEDDDPVIDNDFSNKGMTYAVVPGAFKPPHMGHLKMVQQYVKNPEVDEVIVLISSPMRNQRTLPDGTIVSPEHSMKAWQLLLDSVGLGEPEVKVMVSGEPSPITATFDFIGHDGPLQKGDEVILGASDKKDDNGVPDWHRWLSVDPLKHLKPGVELLDIQKNAVKALGRANNEPFRAGDMRELIGAATKSGKAVSELEEFIGEDNVFDLLAIFGMGPQKSLDEMSSMAAGAVQGAVAANGGPWLDVDINKENEKEKRISKLKRENIDLSIVDGVMELFIERGIIIK
tara:strand:- start:12050 stop:14380 length:2331 start_codon:yes stop_codon:yes gene_type:complete